MVLRAVVGIDGDDVEGFGDFEFVDVAVDGVGEVLRHELVGAAIFANECGLPA